MAATVKNAFPTLNLVEKSDSQFSLASSRLIYTIQKLSMARSIEAIMDIVKKEARALAHSDGATFVLRDGECCYYAEEDAIAPLWKGKRFPLQACVSGWVMCNKKSAIIEDIYNDPRVPQDAYRPTFVKSLLMVPIRSESPIGAIGNYWSYKHTPTEEEIKLLEALANSTSIAMENVNVYSELEKRVKDRTEKLEIANKELESFSYMVSHDLGNQLQVISGFSQILLKLKSDKLDSESLDYINRISNASDGMSVLVQDLLRLSRASHLEMNIQTVNISELIKNIIANYTKQEPKRLLELKINTNVEVQGDPGLLKIVLENLIHNCWKYSSKKPATYIEFGTANKKEGLVYYIRDHGAGFDMNKADKLFKDFHRMHSEKEFPGTGIGLATVAKIIERHHGTIWAESKTGEGTTIYFTLGSSGSTSD